MDLKYKVGTMIEIPRAAITADKIAEEAEFFSFGTNDLTQMTFGFSRDDAGKFLGAYYENKIYENDPSLVWTRRVLASWLRLLLKRAALLVLTSLWVSAASMVAIPAPSSSATMLA